MTIDLGTMQALSKMRNIPMDEIFALVENALVLAYSKQPGAIKNSRAQIDRVTGDFVILAPEVDENGEVIDEFDDTPNNFGRIAASTVRQVLQQRLRDAEDTAVLGEFRDREGTLVSGQILPGGKGGHVQVDLGTVEAILPAHEQVPGEKYPLGSRKRFYLLNASRGNKGPSVTLSRTHPNLVLRLFEQNVPEIEGGLVRIESIAREAGHRSKIAVSATKPGLNAKGACIGDMGARVRAVTEELNDEKIDIVDYSKDPAEFIAAALSPAKVSTVLVLSPENFSARAVVPDDQLSLAIGREGQNARLAAKLTGWRIDIMPESKYAQLRAEEEVAARVQASLEDEAEGEE
ncbi:MAG: transcription termination factor NusA [Rothia sp. (in: high G+C Gram-positive bacteria)]|uniref:transcription termination factor NusA n=1 Tax=Rothia sp. (in: high G+C Gram-positive bacteria) TaxID=1885016 RepID=UPI0026DEDD89|nr:transcription termination factor NusA [Rothia sp. (in: high G+C Gram-positive bacteria)]MDO5750384.1 transcription termination factor NusA [Rothia sp. (in: high G+C Gram-positive bacteria)]